VTGLLSNLLGGSGKAQEVLTVADRLPVLDVTVTSTRQQQQQQHREQPCAAAASASSPEQKWHLEVELMRRSPGTAASPGSSSSSSKSRAWGPKGGSSSSSSHHGGAGPAPRVYAPLFPKVKEEGWWLVVGHMPSLELLAMKRVSFSGKTECEVELPHVHEWRESRAHCHGVPGQRLLHRPGSAVSM